MEPIVVVRTLKRRWRLILAVTILGGVLGYATTLLASDEPDATYYLAIHTLAADNVAGNGNQGGGVNLQKSAFLATTGDVPETVAAEVGVSTDQLARAVSADPRAELGFLEISAVSDDPNEAINIADRVANELVLYLDEEARQELDATQGELNAELVEIENKFNEAAAECAAKPEAERPLCESEKDDIEARYNAKREELRAAEERAEQAAAFSTLQTASAQPISASAYEAAVRSNLAGARGETPTGGASSGDDRPVAQQRVDAASSNEPDPVVRTGLGALVGFILAVGGVFVFDRLDPRLHSKEQTEAAFGFPVLAEVPPLSRQQQRERHVLAFEAPRSRSAEAYRTVRSALLFLDSTEPNGNGAAPNGSSPGLAKPAPGAGGGGGKDAGKDAGKGGGKVLLVTSAGPSEGKTTSVANLATVLAETGASVLVINCDFRRPTLHEYLGGDLLPRKVVDSRVPGVRMVQNVVADARGANPATVVAEQRKLAEAARKHFDVVLLDTAPVLSTNDALDVLPVADQVVVVARAGRTTDESADRAAEKLERLGAPVAGVILVGASSSTGSRYYYYYEPDGDIPIRPPADPVPEHRLEEPATLEP